MSRNLTPNVRATSPLDDPGHALTALTYKRRQRYALGYWCGIVVAVLYSLISVLCAVFSEPGDSVAKRLVLVVTGLGLGALAYRLWYLKRRSAYRKLVLHDRGICLETAVWKSRVPDGELFRLTYHSTESRRVEIDTVDLVAAVVGALVGGLADGLVATGGMVATNKPTRFHDIFFLIETTRGKWMHFFGEVPGSADIAENIRDRIARRVVLGWSNAIYDEQRVEWIEGLYFSKAGLVWPATKKSPLREIRYEELTSFSYDRGWFHLWADGTPSPILSLPFQAPNFYPGLHLLTVRRFPELRPPRTDV